MLNWDAYVVILKNFLSMAAQEILTTSNESLPNLIEMMKFPF